MSSTADLPKVPAPLKNELAKFDASKMKHAETQEKISLPSNDGNYIVTKLNLNH